MLMGVPGSKLSDIQTVYSHPQGLLQCSEFLNRAGYAQCPVANTAVGAVKVRDEGDITQAAIASALAADIYGLEILKDDIVNNEIYHTVKEKGVCEECGKYICMLCTAT